MKIPRPPQKWTAMEDRLLSGAVQSQLIEGKVKDWRTIATMVPGRTNKDCRKRWHNVLAGGLNKGYWTRDEDSKLTQAVQKHGETWTAVAEMVSTRSADQCAKRWKQCLDPQLDHSEWTEEENRRLTEAAAIKGRRWKEIQVEYFPARSRNAIKNQYTILMRRRTRSKSTAKNAAPIDALDTETSQPQSCSSDEDTEGSGQSSDDEGENAVVDRRDPRNSMEGILTQADTVGDIAPGAEDIHLMQDSPWDMLSGFSGDTWDKVLSSMGDPSDTDLYFDGAVPGLPATMPDTTHGYTLDGSKPDVYATPDSSLLPAQGRSAVLFSPPHQIDGAAMMGVEPTQQQELGMTSHDVVTRRGSEGNKVVLIVEDPDKTTVESLMQVVFSSRSRFHFTRE